MTTDIATVPESNDEVALFLDTNSLLHYPPIKDIDWKTVCDRERVRLVLCLQVIHELDEKKDDPRLADRARQAIKEIKALRVAGGVVQDNVTIEVFNQEIRAGDFPDTLSFESKDDRIVQSVRLFSKATSGIPVAVYSEDMGMGLRCEAHNVWVIEPEQSKRLETPESEQQKKYRLAVTELNQIKNRAPVVEVMLTEEAATSPAKNPLIIEVDGTWAERDIAAELKDYVQKKRLLPIELSGAAPPIYPPDHDAVGRYNDALTKHIGRYELWLKNRAAIDQINSHLFRFSLWLTNTGLSPADDLDVVLDFPDVLFSLYEEHHKAVKDLNLGPPPEPPEKPTQRFVDFGGFGLPFRNPDIAMAAMPTRFENRPSVEKGADGKSFRANYSMQRLKHHESEHCGVLIAIVRPDAIRPFQVQYRITAANLPNPATGVIPVILRKRGASSA